MQNTMVTDFHRYIDTALLPIRENPEQSSQSASHYQDAYFENDVLNEGFRKKGFLHEQTSERDAQSVLPRPILGLRSADTLVCVFCETLINVALLLRQYVCYAILTIFFEPIPSSTPELSLLALLLLVRSMLSAACSVAQPSADQSA
jgi:hypothetical protein